MYALVLACIYMYLASDLMQGIAEERGFENLPLLIRLAFIALGTLACVLVHETGHRATGAAMGWPCARFGFGPFEFHRTKDGWRRYRVKMLVGAFVGQVPRTYDHYRLRKAATLLSGPLASLVVGSTFVWLAYWSRDAMTYTLYGRLGTITLLGFLELLPAVRKGIGSDGYRLWQVIRGGTPVDELVRDSLADSSNLSPLRYRDWPHDVVLRLAESGQPYDLYLAFIHSNDAGDIEAEEIYVRRLMASLPAQDLDAHGRHYACEIACWLALRANDPAAATQWLERAGTDADWELQRRAHAAIALASGDFDRAAELAEAALADCPMPPPRGFEMWDVERLQRILSAARAGQASLVAS